MSRHHHLVCPHCDSVNRVPVERDAGAARCGVCQRQLFDGQPTELTQARFEKHVQRSDIPVLVDFWAPWCGPCKMMAPAFAQAAAELEPEVRCAKVNTDQEQALAMAQTIRGIPTLILYRDGQEAARSSGAMDLRRLVTWVRQQL